ncbi:MAG: VCBS repeat-containing protein [Spirosomaceae bacterium]|nr:VCBS repeat-containing protein [Spirosomataceae bacterium]
MLFKKLDPNDTGVAFVNQITETEQDNVLNYEYFYNGGGVAAADFNNDGLTDLYFTANQGDDKLYLNVTPRSTGGGQVKFEDITQTAFKMASGGGGAAWKTGVTVVDINQDGWQDIYVSVSANIENESLRRNRLYINNKDLTFTEKAREYGLDDKSYTTQTAFFDYDRDGDLDAYMLNHNVKDFKRFDVQAVHFMRDSLAGDKLLRNDNGKFVDVSVQAGIKGNPIGFGLGIHTADVNNDGWTDIYVSNDYYEEDYLYLNNQDGTFTDHIKTATNHISYFSMGNDIGDINNDLLPDIITTDMLPEDNKRQKLLFGPDKYEAFLSMLKNGMQPSFMRNMLHINNPQTPARRTVPVPKGGIKPTPPLGAGGLFSEIGQLAGLSNTDWSWSVLMADYDNDGHKDVFITNGYLRDYTNMDFQKFYAEEGMNQNQSVIEVVQRMPSTKTPNYIFQNNHNLTFANRQKEWGFDQPIISNGAVYVDLDNDGDLEIVTNNINEPASIYQNLSREQNKGNFLSIQLDIPQKQTLATGTKIYLFADSLRQYREFTPTHGYQSSMMIPVHFGLGQATEIDSLVIVWPNDKMQKITKVTANQLLKIGYQPNAISFTPLPYFEPIFEPTNHLTDAHQQTPFNDFNRQILLPQMYSYAGPRMAQGDVNADGLEDLYIGGGKGQAGRLFTQKPDGQFVWSVQSDFKQDELCTDTDAVLFDADRDGDLDLYVTSGGYEYLPNDLMLQNRLYLNDGKGRFTKTYENLTDGMYADACVKTIDYDRDGDLDLFVGGGVVPHQFPRYNPSRLLRNDGGKFTDADQSVFDDLGIVTDACVTDLNQDGRQDLVVVGEWTGILCFENQGGTFVKTQEQLADQKGLWQRIATADMDGDGDQDLLVGNHGLNSQWRASDAEPMSLLVDDFDDNGRLDPILSYFIQGKNYPNYSRDELLEQLVPLKKKYTSHALFSTATTEDIMAEFKTKTPQKLTVNQLKSVWLRNNGGTFETMTLPIEAQMAPICAILITDLNNDQRPDVVLAGNQSHARVRNGNIDANLGQVFINKGSGVLSYLPQYQSGLYLKGDVRDLKIIGRQMVVGINSQASRAYQRRVIP